MAINTTSSTTGTILRSDGTNIVATTATYPTTTTVSQLLYSSATNTIAGLATANRAALITSNTGVPSLLTASGTAGVALVSAGGAAAPVWSTVVVAGGGTGRTTHTAFSLICGGTTTTGAQTSIASVAVGQVLVSNGTAANPVYSATPTITSVRLTATTIALLPSAVGIAGTTRFVTDALAPVFAAIVAAGGAVYTPVYSDGTNWRCG
jgi:hypothetical protein